VNAVKKVSVVSFNQSITSLFLFIKREELTMMSLFDCDVDYTERMDATSLGCTQWPKGDC